MSGAVALLGRVDWSVVIAAAISLWAIRFAAQQAKAAREQAEISRQQSDIAKQQTSFTQQALSQGRLAGLYSSFDLANQAILGNPSLLYDVHGLPVSIPPDEAKRLVYLSILLDAHQEHWTDLYNGDCLQVLGKIRTESTFLSRTLAVKANHKRWELLKPIFYGDFDKDFVCVIDALIADEKKRVLGASGVGPEKEVGPEDTSQVKGLSHNPHLQRTADAAR